MEVRCQIFCRLFVDYSGGDSVWSYGVIADDNADAPSLAKPCPNLTVNEKCKNCPYGMGCKF